MPTFATPEPITVTIELAAGDIRVTASDRTDTVVEVRPQDRSNMNDVKAAEEARVEYSNGKLLIKAPKPLQVLFGRKTSTIDVTIELPTGSHVRGGTACGELVGEGQLGDCMFRTSYGDIHLDQAQTVNLTTMHGKTIVDKTAGDCHVTGSGEIRIREVEGAAAIRNLNGHSWIGSVTGTASLNSAHGNIAVGRAGSDVEARTAYGNVRVDDITNGSVRLQTAYGDVEVGVHKGTAAWLDVKSTSGKVRSELAPTDNPGSDGGTVEVRARTAYGHVTIKRSVA